MKIIYEPKDVTIRDVRQTPVAILEHRGDRATLGDTIERLVAWRKAAGLSPDRDPTFNIFRSERTPANPADYSMDLCVGTDLPIDPNDPVMKSGVIPAGCCASSTTPTIWRRPRFSSTATGFPRAARK